MNGERSSQCYNEEISGEWTRSDVSHKKTFNLDESNDRKRKAKETRKRKTGEKAAALLSQSAALRADPRAAGNPEAHAEAIAAIQFDYGDRDDEPLSSAAQVRTADARLDRDFAAIYMRLDSTRNDGEFRLHYDDEENYDSEDDEENEGSSE